MIQHPTIHLHEFMKNGELKIMLKKSGYLLEALREHPKVTTGLLLSKGDRDVRHQR